MKLAAALLSFPVFSGENPRPGGNRLQPGDAAWALLIGAVLYLRYFRWPALPIDPLIGDQSIFLSGAVRILDGEFIYRDFFQFNTPGMELFYCLLIKIFGQNAILPRAVSVAAGVAYFLLGMAISRRVLSGWRVYLGPLLFLAVAYVPVLNPMHHVFSALLILGALVLLLDGAEPGAQENIYFWAGMLCGLAVFFTTSRAISVAVIALFLLRIGDRGKAALRFSLATALTVFLLLAPLLAIVGTHTLWNDLVTFPLTAYRSWPGNSLMALGTDFPATDQNPVLFLVAACKWLLLYLMPAVLILFAATRHRHEHTSEDRKLWLIWIVGVGLFLSVAFSPFAFRLAAVLLPCTILAARYLDSGRVTARIISLGLAAFAAIMLPAGIWHSQQTGAPTVETPAGTVVIRAAPVAATEERYRWLAANSHPGDYLYSTVQPGDYYLFRLRNPSPVPFLTMYRYTTPEQVSETVEAIKMYRVRYVIWPVELQTVTRSTDAVPAGEDQLEPLRELLRRDYRVAHTFADLDQVWERK